VTPPERDPAPEGGAAPRPDPAPQRDRPGMSFRYMVIAGVVIGCTYAIGAIVRGAVAPGIVGGVLAAILTVLVLREMGERRRRRGR
jgi:hypothetical protein